LIPFHSRKIPKINGKQDSTKSFWTIEHKEAKDYAKLSKGGKGHNKIGFSTWAIEKYENRINSSVDPYALGVYIGDGNSTTGNVNITTSHESIINKIPYKFLSARKKNGTEAKNYYYSKMGDFTQEITRLDLLKKKSAHKFIPKECLLSDKNYRIKLLAGLIDTDGYLGKNCLSYSTISEQLAKDVEQLDNVYDLATCEFLVGVCIDPAKYKGKKADEGTAERFLMEIEGGRDSDGNVIETSVTYVMRNNFTLENTVVHQSNNTIWGEREMTGGTAKEIHLYFTVKIKIKNTS